MTELELTRKNFEQANNLFDEIRLEGGNAADLLAASSLVSEAYKSHNLAMCEVLRIARNQCLHGEASCDEVNEQRLFEALHFRLDGYKAEPEERLEALRDIIAEMMEMDLSPISSVIVRHLALIAEGRVEMIFRV